MNGSGIIELNNWLNARVPYISKSLEETNMDYLIKNKTIGFAGKELVYKVLFNLRCALFPGVYEKYPIDETNINIIIGNNLRVAATLINNLIEKALTNNCKISDCLGANCSKCKDKAYDTTMKLINKMPEIRELLHSDIQAAYIGDPAAHSYEEILLSYPSIETLSIYRITHVLYELNVPLIPRIMSEYSHQLTGIDIHPGAKIGKNFFIDHGTGVVIGETCTIGNNVKLYQGVTLGAKSFQLDDDGNPVKSVKRHPDIEDNVVIYAGATVLGGDTRIGHDSIIGGNVWLTQSVEPYSRVYNSQPLPTIKVDPN